MVIKVYHCYSFAYGRIEEKEIKFVDGPSLVDVVKSLQERSATLLEMAEGAAFYFIDPVVYDEKGKKKFLIAEQRELFKTILEILCRCEVFDKVQLELSFAEIMAEAELKFGKVAQPLRVALTGGVPSPGIYEVLQVLGKERSLQRIEQAIMTIA